MRAQQTRAMTAFAFLILIGFGHAQAQPVASLFSTAADSIHGKILEGPETIPLVEGGLAQAALIELLFANVSPRDIAADGGIEDVTKNLNRVLLTLWAVRIELDPPPVTRLNLGGKFPDYKPVYWPVIFLGTGHGFDWYARVPFTASKHIREALELEGGTDPVAAAIAQLAVAEATSATAARSAEIIIRAGNEAVSAVKEAVEKKLPGRAAAIRLMQYSMPPRIVTYLIHWSLGDDPKVAEASKYVLLAAPQKRASSIYVHWLKEGDVKPDYVLPLLWKGAVSLDDVQGLMDTWFEDYAFQAETIIGLIERGYVPPEEARAVLKPIVEGPDTLAQYQRTYQLDRALAGEPTDATDWEIGSILWDYGRRPADEPDPPTLTKALHYLSHSKDPETVAVVGILLAAANVNSATPSNEDESQEEPIKARKIGREILDRLDPALVKKKLKALEWGVLNETEKGRLKKLLEEYSSAR